MGDFESAISRMREAIATQFTITDAGSDADDHAGRRSVYSRGS